MVDTGQLRVFPTADGVAEEAAERIADVLRKTVAESGSCVAALTGGRTPVATYQRLATYDLPWAAIHVVQTDDRFLPADETGTNWRTIRDTLLDPAGVPEDRRHPMPVRGDDPKVAAATYADLLKSLTVNGSADLVLLQLGPDGHLAALFDGRYDPADPAGVVVTSPGGDVVRLTQTLPSLCGAATRIALATGEQKSLAVGKVRSGSADTVAARAFLGSGGLLLLDNEAGSGR
jgi:6-phosphogluconolactonase